MLLKRIFAGVLCAVILAGGVRYGVTFRFFDRALSAKLQKEFLESIDLPNHFTLTASADSTDAARNSLQAAKQAAESGAHALELNVSFDERNVPYLADGASFINAESVTLESVFKANEKRADLRYLLNLKTVAASPALLSVIRKYDLRSRVILCGFSLQTASEFRNDYPELLLCADVDASTADLQNAAACRRLMFRCVKAGAAYIRCSTKDVTPALLHAIRNNDVRLIIDKAHTDYEIYYALSCNPEVVVTDRPAELYELLYDNEYLRREMEEPFVQ